MKNADKFSVREGSLKNGNKTSHVIYQEKTTFFIKLAKKLNTWQRG